MENNTKFVLEDGSRVAVLGAGPAGTFFTYFFLDMAERAGLEASVDIYESRDFSKRGPIGCNMCGGIISESMVQTLATDGINLPATVVKRGIDSYVLSLDVGKINIASPLHEKRIAAVHRGAGPRGSLETSLCSFDGYLLELGLKKGAHLIPKRVDDIVWEDNKPVIQTRDGDKQSYDLVVIAMGVKTGTLKIVENLVNGYKSPDTTRTYICELPLGHEMIQSHLTNSIHLFLPNIPHVEFSCLIPKGEYVTLCLLGDDIDENVVRTFLDTKEVRQCLPADWNLPKDICHCAPKMSIAPAMNFFTNRIVVVGDSGITRLNKDGIGAAYRTAKAAAVTAVFNGVSQEDFRKHYYPVCNFIKSDNRYGKWLFLVMSLIQRWKFLRRGILRTIQREQKNGSGNQIMSLVFWDTFTGNAHYREVFYRTLNPLFILRVLTDIMISLWPTRTNKSNE